MFQRSKLNRMIVAGIATAAIAPAAAVASPAIDGGTAAPDTGAPQAGQKRDRPGTRSPHRLHVVTAQV